MKKKIISAAAALMILCACTEINEETDAVPADGPVSASSSEAMSEASSETVPEASAEDTAETTAETESSTSLPITEESEAVSETSAESVYETYSEITETEAMTEAETEAQTEETSSDCSVESISLTFYEVTLTTGEHKMPIVSMSPENAPDKSEIWTSSDESVASVDSLGNITAKSAGKCTITVASAACPEVTAQVSVTVEEAPGLTYIKGILIANKTYSLPPDYNPGVSPEAQAAFDEMQSAAAKEGLNIYISSAFRSYEYQSGLYDRYVSRSGKAEADRYSARPGHSEHQTGLAFDLNTIDISFADTEEYEWLKENCADYGFIIRYPEDGEEITGYMYEPWHIRYLGKETAKKVYESGLTLEEYLGIDSKYAE